MINKHFKSLLTAGCVMAAMGGAAQAGGFSRGTADTDILFEPGNFAMRAGVTIVNPSRKFSDGPVFTAGGVPTPVESDPDNMGEDYANTYVVPSGAVKFKMHDNVSCAGTVTQAYGGDVSFTEPKLSTSVLLGKQNESFTVMEYGATCAIGFDLSKGRISILGGAFLENFSYDVDVRSTNLLETTLGAGQSIDIDLKGNAVGWRVGLAYEIPEIALRAQVMYRSGTSLSPEGSASSSGVLTGLGVFGPSGNSFGEGKLPQSVEIKLQSGIAPGWLAYGSVKWTDWSVNEQLTLGTDMFSAVQPGGVYASVNNYFWRDGWTVTGGIGHAFNESISGTAFVTWDRGVSTGWDLMSDTYTFGLGASLKDSIGGELRFGGAVSYLGSASETENPNIAASMPLGIPVPGSTANYSVGSDWSFAASAGYVVRW